MFPRIVKTGLVSAEMLRQEELFLFQVQKTEAESGDYVRIDQLIGELNKAKKHGRSKVGLAFGYDDDPRELIEIPEVCQYVTQIFSTCPHLLYFLLPDPDAIRTFVFCMIGARVTGRSGGTAHLEANEDAFNAKVKELADAVVSYGARIGDAHGARAHLAEIGI
ncbi:MAG: hypothetical protein AAGU74_01320 [Bacillota bacterium]